MPSCFTWFVQLLSICHWIAAILSIERGVSLHFDEGSLAKVPVLVHGGSSMTRSASVWKGKGLQALAIIGSAFAAPMRRVSSFQTLILRRE